jgi:carbamoyl-phosphate synthase large subunit
MIQNKVNILITGCGGDIGQSVGKILNELDFVNNLYGCDISDKNAAKFIYTNFFIGLPCNNENYINNLEQIVVDKKIDFIIPIAEPELRFFSKKKIFKIGNATLITASPESLEIGFDKLSTANFLKKVHLPFPVTNSVQSIETVEKFPVILKSKTGSGSSNVVIVKDNESYLSVKKNNPDFIVQEYLEGENGEYTCGLFRSSHGSIWTIILKRELMGGFTGYAEVIKDKSIDTVLHQIAEKLQLTGSINVQLRLTSKGPVVFEINPRFSSTVRFRHLLGFEDLKWSIMDKMGYILPEYKESAIGKKIYKGFNEYIE